MDFSRLVTALAAMASLGLALPATGAEPSVGDDDFGADVDLSSSSILLTVATHDRHASLVLAERDEGLGCQAPWGVEEWRGADVMQRATAFVSQEPGSRALLTLLGDPPLAPHRGQIVASAYEFPYLTRPGGRGSVAWSRITPTHRVGGLRVPGSREPFLALWWDACGDGFVERLGRPGLQRAPGWRQTVDLAVVGWLDSASADVPLLGMPGLRRVVRKCRRRGACEDLQALIQGNSAPASEVEP